MCLRAASLPRALQHFFAQLAQCSQISCTQNALYVACTSLCRQLCSARSVHAAVSPNSLPCATTNLDLPHLGSRTHDKLPYEAMGIHGGTPAAHHHSFSFFLQGQLKVEGSIWH